MQKSQEKHVVIIDHPVKLTDEEIDLLIDDDDQALAEEEFKTYKIILENIFI